MNLCSAFSIDIFKCALQASDLWVRSDISIIIQAPLAAAISPLAISPSTLMNEMRPDHNSGTIYPTLCDKCVGSFTSLRVVWTVKGCETGPTIYSPYPRRLESLTICGCSNKGSTFSSAILRPWVLVRPESNSRPPAWQPDAQPTEPTIPKLRRHGDSFNKDKKRRAMHLAVVTIALPFKLFGLANLHIALLHKKRLQCK